MAIQRALVVEDSPSMRQLLIFALSRIPQMEVVEAEDGLDAWRALLSEHFDIALVDINMPIMDGLKLVQRIRADDRTKHLPIVIVTTEGADEDRKRAIAMGANAYITKPVRSPQIIETVKGLLGL